MELMEKGWKSYTFQLGGIAVTAEVRRMNALAAAPLVRITREVMGDMDYSGNALLVMSRIYERLGAFASESEDSALLVLRRMFAKNIRNVGGLEVDGEVVTTGEGLFDVADETLFSLVVSALRERSSLTAVQGKVLPLPSSSGLATEGKPSPEAGAFPVVPANGAGGTVPETAPEFQAEPPSSSALA